MTPCVSIAAIRGVADDRGGRSAWVAVLAAHTAAIYGDPPAVEAYGEPYRGVLTRAREGFRTVRWVPLRAGHRAALQRMGPGGQRPGLEILDGWGLHLSRAGKEVSQG